MAHIKSKWWRSNTPEWPESPDHKASECRRKETEYLRWLAEERAFGEVCPQCNGRGQMAAIFGTRSCGYCNGSGGSGITHARAYVSAQCDELDMIALCAVDGLKRRLFWRGLRPVVYGGSVKAALTVAEYDAREAERDRLDAALAEAREAIYAAEATADADYRDVSDGADLSEILASVHAAHERERDIADRRFALGHVDETRWALPSSAGTVHLGIRGARRGYGYVKPAHSIVIEPGRAPSPAELDALADEAVAALSADSLPLAA